MRGITRVKIIRTRAIRWRRDGNLCPCWNTGRRWNDCNYASHRFDVCRVAGVPVTSSGTNIFYVQTERRIRYDELIWRVC